MENYLIKLEPYLNTINEFKEYIRKNKNIMLLGQEKEGICDIYLLYVKKDGEIIKQIAIFVNDPIKPKFLQKGNKIYIIYNHIVAIIGIEKFEIIKKIENISIAYDILDVCANNKIIVISELGVQQIDLDGNILWNEDTDIIENYYIEGNYIIIKTDSTIKKINISNGKTLN